MDLVEELAQALESRQRGRRVPAQALVKSFDQMVGDYAGGDGAGAGDAAVQGMRDNLNSLTKSMSIGDSGSSALQLENLDATMTEVLVTEQFMKLFNAINRTPSDNTLFEWNRKKNYGSFRGTAGFREGGAPNGSSAKYQRGNATIRFLGERGGVTHQLSTAGQRGGYAVDPVAEENRNTTVRLMAKIERQLFRGQEAIKETDNGQTVHYDGIMPFMAANYAANVIDMKGQPMSFDQLEGAAYNLRQNGKLLNFNNLKGFASPFIMQDLGALKRGYEYTKLTTGGSDPLVPGTPFGGYQSQFGYIPMDDSLFLDEVEGDIPLNTDTGADPNAPSAPGSVTGANTTDATSLLAAATYYYFASAFNSQGESLTTASTGVAVASGEKATVTIARVAGATGYRLYRATVNNVAKAQWVATIPQTVSGAASYVDLNGQRPGTGTYLLFNADPADITIAQMAPLTKWPLAITSTTIEFLLFLYHTLVIKAPERVIVWKNVGKAS